MKGSDELTFGLRYLFKFMNFLERNSIMSDGIVMSFLVILCIPSYSIKDRLSHFSKTRLMRCDHTTEIPPACCSEYMMLSNTIFMNAFV